MKITIMLTIPFALLIPSIGSAMLTRDAVSSFIFPVYGIFTTSDPLCLTGLKATMALSATPNSKDLLSSPQLGSGPMATPTACVIVVVKNSMSYTVKAGTYTSTTNGQSDNVCNAGTTITNEPICDGGETPSYGAELTAALSAAGLTGATSCQNATGNEVIALYISTASLCTGNNYYDPQNPPCPGSGGQIHIHGFNSPTSTTDYYNGLHLGGITAGGSAYKFVLDPDESVGNSGGSCDFSTPPRFRFLDKT